MRPTFCTRLTLASATGSNSVCVYSASRVSSAKYVRRSRPLPTSFSAVSSPVQERSGRSVGSLMNCAFTVDVGTPDRDHDGFGVAGGDCDDTDPARRPGAPEVANGLDDDCDGTVDEGTSLGDDDHDGYTEAGGDCDDADPDRSPARGTCP